MVTQGEVASPITMDWKPPTPFSCMTMRFRCHQNKQDDRSVPQASKCGSSYNDSCLQDPAFMVSTARMLRLV
ncbi:hypothetical protein SNOG_02637 [Parastagonospora nodorum SN15]|uniref:Uncharacterized protein n=1 Tax=Phaeosphaeria nodorum (strain SN15 / ATCC MYA-4574 / FGSC 10173) TaxID=321614 RepID=Q0V027_PHANO|nr:hypothetical protein SNOG_02637 [Parastagonospora nodorum SN15]EAT89368.1 hypothetical protein SNOG_02637 [Parastagonospora nodorum SN15]